MGTGVPKSTAGTSKKAPYGGGGIMGGGETLQSKSSESVVGRMVSG